MTNYKWLEIKAHPDLHKSVISIIDSLKLNKNIEILVLASWSWAFDLRLYNYGFKNITSVEINESEYKNNKSKIKEFKLIDLNSFFSKNFNEKYDLIICMEIIEHVYNPNNFLIESKKLLKDKNSQIIISTPNLQNLFSRINYVLFWYPNYFIVRPWLYDHVSPIFHNIFEHLSEINWLKIQNTYFKNFFLKHFKFHGLRSYFYLIFILLLSPLIFIFSIFNRKYLFWSNSIFILSKL